MAGEDKRENLKDVRGIWFAFLGGYEMDIFQRHW